MKNARNQFNSATPEITDQKALDHIVSGNPFHITSGDNWGKYVFKTGDGQNGKKGLYKYGMESGVSTLKRSYLPTQALFDAMTQGYFSIDSMAFEGKARPTTMNLVFLEDLVDHDGFQITAGLGSGSYGFEVSSGKIELMNLVPEISGGTVAGFLSQKADLRAEDLIISLQKGTFRAGIENSILFNLAKGKKDHVTPPRRSLGV